VKIELIVSELDHTNDIKEERVWAHIQSYVSCDICGQIKIAKVKDALAAAIAVLQK
jgi:hypothetical protein